MEEGGRGAERREEWARRKVEEVRGAVEEGVRSGSEEVTEGGEGGGRGSGGSEVEEKKGVAPHVRAAHPEGFSSHARGHKDIMAGMA